jgi:hypothetical protein
MILHQNSFFTAKSTSDYAGARSINTAVLQETGAGYREILCLPGPFSTDPEEIEVWPNFSVSSAKTIAQIPARPGAYNVDGAGRCEIGTPFPENTQLRCDLEQPILGSIVAGLEFPGYKVYSEGFLHFAHVADMDPVSLFQFDGSSADVLGHAEWAFEEAFNNPAAHFVLRNERYLGSFPGHLVYRKLMFPWTRIPQAKEVTK